MRGVSHGGNAPSLVLADPGHLNFMLSGNVTASFSDNASCLRNALDIVAKSMHC